MNNRSLTALDCCIELPRAARSLTVTCVTLALAYGIWYSYTVFLVALLREFGWSRSVLAGAFSVFVLVHGLSSLVLGPLADRLGPRRLVVAGGLLLTVALPLNGGVARPWQLYLTFGLLTGIGVATAGWLPAVVLVQRWFSHRVGAALGVASAGVGLGIFVVVPCVQLLIEHVGWRSAYRALGAVMLVWVVPATLWLVHDPPPSPARSTPAPAPARAEVATPTARGRPHHDASLAQAVRFQDFWVIFAAQILGNSASQMLLVHQAAYLVDHGISAIAAASVVSVVGLASIAGKTGGGWLSDIVGRGITYALGMVCVIVSIGVLGLLALSPAAGLAFVYAGFVGLGYSVTAPIIPAVVSDLFRGRHYGAIFGALYLANALGGSFGPWLAGRIFDATGSYQAAFAIAIFTATLSAFGLWIAAPRRPR